MRFMPRLVSAALLLAMTAAAVIASDANQDEANDPGFVITLWCGPDLAHTTLEDYQRIADAGFNVVLPPSDCWTPEPKVNHQILDLCKQVGIKAMIGDLRIVQIGMLHHNTIHAADVVERVNATIAEYRDHPALYAYFVTDEPCSKDIPDLAALCRHISAQDAKHPAYVNLFPMGDPAYFAPFDYPGHVSEYIAKAEPAILSWDHYTQMQGASGNGGPSYFANLEQFRKVCLKTATPYFEFILSTADATRGYREPSEVDLRWQVYSGLAYGAHGVGYFTYWTFTGMQQGIVSADGKPSAKYEYVKRINNRIKWLGPTLAKLASAGVYHSEPLPEGTMKLAAGAPVKKMVGGEMVLGWLKDAAGKDFLFVFNRSFTEKFKAQLTLDAAFKKAEEISQETGKAIAASLSAGVLSCDLEPGHGRLFELGK